MNKLIFMISLAFVLCGQSYAQWQRTNLPDSVRINALAISDSNVLAGTDGDGIYLSTDYGDNWESMNAGLQNNIIHAIFIDGTRIFAGTETGASISTDNGATWTTADSGLSDEGVWSFAAMNNAPGDSVIFAGTWSGVYKSTDDGKSWEATGLTGTTMPVHSLIVKGSQIFAATLAGGVFLSQSNGFSWDDISIRYKDPWSGSELVRPVYSLAMLDTNVIASVDTGCLSYYTGPPDPFTGTPGLFFTPIANGPKGRSPILCFANHNARLYAGNSNGDIFLSGLNWLYWQATSPSLKGHTIYSLAVNNSYYFAGTESGVWRLAYPETGTYAADHDKPPKGFVLQQNYPNPFNPTTVITYQLPAVSNVSLRVYDVLGRPVATLVNERQTAGKHSVRFEASGLPSGIYFYSLVTDKFKDTKKSILLK